MKKYKIKEKLKKLWTHLNNLLDIFDRNHTFMLAAGIAFNILIYIIPLILIAIYVSSNFVNLETLNNILEDIFYDFLPPTESNYNFFKGLLNEIYLINKHSSLFGIIGIIGLLWISSTLLSAIRVGLNTVFELQPPKISFIYRFKDILLTLIFAVLMILYSYAIPIIGFFLEVFGGTLPDWIKSYFSVTVLFTVSIITSFIIFYIIYRYVPNKRIQRKKVLISTILCVVLIETSRHVFAYYMTSFANYGKFYGTYAIIISLSVWIYYSSVIILLSAEISNYLYKIKENNKF